GTTRDAITVNLDIEGFPVTLTDTAGIRESNDKIEKLGINKSLIKAKEADLKIIVLDAINFSTSLQQIEKLVKENCLILINKLDLINENIKNSIDIILKNKSIKYIFISLKLDTNLDLFNKI